MSQTILAACVSMCAFPFAYGDAQTYINDYAGFASAAGALSTIDFETQPNGQQSQPGIQITATYNYDAQGVHFSAPVQTPILAGNPVGGFELRVTIPNPVPSSRTWIVANPLEPVYAAGAHFAGDSYLFAYDSAGNLIDYAYYLQGGANHFLGIISTTPIDFVIFDRTDWSASINDFHFSPIPEPATALLFALGLIRLRRTRRHE